MLGLLVTGALLAAAHVAVPLELSRRGRRHGWGDRPGPANLLGAIPLAAGTSLLGWAVAGQAAAAPHGWALPRGLEPEVLLTEGAYRLSRNPMHVGGLAIWSGWAIWFGSAPVTAGLAVAACIYRAGIAREEQALARRWGTRWQAYAARTPRWLSASSARSAGA